MITAERLEELIKQGGTVYIGNTTHINLSNRDYVKYDKNDNAYYLVHRDMWFGLSVIYETKKERDWVIKTHTERIERFEPLLWDDIDTQYEFNFFDRQFIRPGIYSVRHMRFSAYNGDKDKEVYLYDETSREYEIYEQHATKENYEKACEVVRELFNKRGEK